MWDGDNTFSHEHTAKICCCEQCLCLGTCHFVQCLRPNKLKSRLLLCENVRGLRTSGSRSVTLLMDLPFTHTLLLIPV